MPKPGGKVKPHKPVDFLRREIWFLGVRNNCIKCLGTLTEGEFVVNKEMAYCDDCARLLHLGESKESKMFQGFQDSADAGEAGPSHGPDLAGVTMEENAALDI
jgi:hypothetical protein